MNCRNAMWCGVYVGRVKYYFCHQLSILAFLTIAQPAFQSHRSQYSLILPLLLAVVKPWWFQSHQKMKSLNGKTAKNYKYLQVPMHTFYGWDLLWFYWAKSSLQIWPGLMFIWDSHSALHVWSMITSNLRATIFCWGWWQEVWQEVKIKLRLSKTLRSFFGSGFDYDRSR